MTTAEQVAMERAFTACTGRRPGVGAWGDWRHAWKAATEWYEDHGDCSMVRFFVEAHREALESKAVEPLYGILNEE